MNLLDVEFESEYDLRQTDGFHRKGQNTQDIDGKELNYF